MPTVPTTTIVGYDVDSGKQLFTHPNVPVRDYKGNSSLPRVNQIYKSSFNDYLVIRVRRSSTETLWEIDVRVEPR